MPANRLVNTNSPSLSVTVSRVTAVAVFRTVTVAPGTAPLLLSITEPPIWPLSPWACASPGVPTARANVRRARTPLKRFTFPPQRVNQVPSGFQRAHDVAFPASRAALPSSRRESPRRWTVMVYVSFVWALSTKNLRHTKGIVSMARSEQRVDVSGGVADVLSQHGVAPVGSCG